MIEKPMLVEMKTFTKPPPLVVLVMNSVCLLFGEKEEWDSSKKLLGKMSFLNDLIDFNVDLVPDKKLLKLK